MFASQVNFAGLIEIDVAPFECRSGADDAWTGALPDADHSLAELLAQLAGRVAARSKPAQAEASGHVRQAGSHRLAAVLADCASVRQDADLSRFEADLVAHAAGLRRQIDQALQSAR